MTLVEGYLDHEVIQDFNDPGHLVVATLYDTQEHANAVLTRYVNDPKIKQATVLGKEPTGFLGNVIS